MPRLLLATATLAVAAAAVLPASAQPAPAASAACKPVPVRQVVEAFVSADCAACWQHDDGGAAPDTRTLRLDWVVPGTQADDAPLAAAALPEAAQRLKEFPPSLATAALLRRQAVPALPAGVQLEVASGLAWNGYIGVSFEVRRGAARPFPAGATGWLALVERVPAGQDGTPMARQLVRALVGPLPLEMTAGTRKLHHLRAVLLPPNSQAERLAAVGWVEQADGRLLAAAQSVPASCDTP